MLHSESNREKTELNSRRAPGRIMCIRLGSMGDIIFALHALRLLRKERPDLWISWLVEDRFAGLVENHPDLDAVYVVPRKRWGRDMIRSLRLPALAAEAGRFAGELRKLDISITIDFHGNLRSGLWAYSVGAPMRIGYDKRTGKEFNHIFQNEYVHPHGRNLHRILRHAFLLGPLGIKPRYERPIIPVSPNDSEQIKSLVAPHKVSDRSLVIIHPASSRFGSIKRWKPERFAAVADRLIRKDNCLVMVSWGPGEKEEALNVVALMTEKGVVAPRTQTLGQLAALLGLADLVIASDTGPLHMAAALERPVVGLYGPKSPEVYGPVGTTGRIIVGKASCAPCRKRKCRSLICMDSIEIGHVYWAAHQVLKGKGKKLTLMP